MMNGESEIKGSINQLGIFLFMVATLAYFQRWINADRLLTRCLCLKLGSWDNQILFGNASLTFVH